VQWARYNRFPDFRDFRDLRDFAGRSAARNDGYERGSRTEVEHVAEVFSQTDEVIAQLPLAMCRKAFSRLDLDDYRALHEPIAPVEANLLTPKLYGNRKLTIDVKTVRAQKDLHRSGVDGL
jgi:hypothetical protein